MRVFHNLTTYKSVIITNNSQLNSKQLTKPTWLPIFPANCAAWNIEKYLLPQWKNSVYRQSVVSLLSVCSQSSQLVFYFHCIVRCHLFSNQTVVSTLETNRQYFQTISRLIIIYQSIASELSVCIQKLTIVWKYCTLIVSCAFFLGSLFPSCRQCISIQLFLLSDCFQVIVSLLSVLCQCVARTRFRKGSQPCTFMWHVIPFHTGKKENMQPHSWSVWKLSINRAGRTCFICRNSNLYLRPKRHKFSMQSANFIP